MNEHPIVITIVAGILAVLTTTVSLRTLKGNPVLGNPLISVCVGILGAIGVCLCTSKALLFVLMPYVALVLCLPVVLFLLLLFGSSKESGPDTTGKRSSNLSEPEEEDVCEHQHHELSIEQEGMPNKADEDDE